MKSLIPWIVSGALAATWVGCSGDDEGPSANNNSANNNTTNNDNTTNNNSVSTNNNSDNNNNVTVTYTCPVTTSTLTETGVCDLKNEDSDRYPAFDSTVRVDEVVVTAAPYTILEDDDTGGPLMGFFVQDPNTTTELASRFSGIHVTFNPDTVQGPMPTVGHVINVEGTFNEFGPDDVTKQKQILVTTLASATATVTPPAATVVSAADIAEGTEAAAYEAVLVQIEDVTVTADEDIPGRGTNTIFGAFTVDGGLVVSNALYNIPGAATGQLYARIAGVLRLGTAPFDGGVYQLSPRDSDDVEIADPGQFRRTVANLKVDGNPMQPNLGDPVILEGVLVTSPAYTILEDDDNNPTLRGFFVQDQNPANDGRFSGIQVTYRPSEIQGDIPTTGDIVNLSGVLRDFGQDGDPRQKQLGAVLITDTSSDAEPPVITIESPADIATGGPDAMAYEGVLVKVESVTVQASEDVPGRGGNVIFNAFTVDDDLVISGSIYTERGLLPGDEITEIVGILRLGTAPFDGGIYQLTPRASTDVVVTNPRPKITSLPMLQNEATPDRPQLCVGMGGVPVGLCPRVEIPNVVVTAVDGFVTGNLRMLFVQDPSVTDGRWAGAKVVYDRNSTGIPSVGDIIDLRGEAIEFFDGTQIQNPEFDIIMPGAGNIDPTVVLPTDLPSAGPSNTNPYEGVLVRIENVTVTEACTDSNGDRGNFTVAGATFIGSTWFYDYNGDFCPGGCDCGDGARNNDMRTQGDVFTSITGVMNYSFNIYRLEPRNNGDLVMQ